MSIPDHKLASSPVAAPSTAPSGWFARLFQGLRLAVALGLLLAVVQPGSAEVDFGPFPPEEAIEDQVEEQVEEQLEEELAQNLEDNVEETVEEGVEEAIEDGIEDSIQDSLEDEVEESVAENVEETIEDSIEETIEDTVEESIAENIEEAVEDSVEEAVEESVAENVEEAVEESVEEAVEESVAENVEESVEESVEEAVEESVAENVEESVEESVEEAVEESVAENVEESVEDNVEQAVEESVAQNVEEAVEEDIVDSLEDRLEITIDDILEQIESEFEIDEDRIHKDQWLVMAEPEVFEKLASEGYLFDKVTELPGIGMRLAEVAAPSSFDITEVRQGVMDVLGTDHAEVDLNHIYTAGAPLPSPSEAGVAPRTAVAFPTDTENLALRIGMIDSQVDVAHPALSGSHIESRSFAPKGAKLPNFHGTAIASIIAGDNNEYHGLAPNTELYAAAVFEKDRDRGEIASTVSLVMALDWLMSSGVDVVNISLAGPPNRLLQSALKRAAEKDVLIVAAAGNGGPVAQPMYPAAYDSVVAVTAVDTGGKVFRLANRGEYLDLAAPGVRMLHAKAGGGYAASSGTSFAVPFAATAAARIRALHPNEDALKILYQNAEDLGAPGRDEVYGYGLLRPENTIPSGAQTASR
jgi:subtilisin family serine protease